MLPLLQIFTLAQAIPVPPPTPIELKEVVQPQEVRALPGQLDNVPVFNSNSPEVVQREGILLSTFPPDNKAVREAHLNLPLDGRFDLFAHHIARARTPRDTQPMYLGVIVYNPSTKPIKVDI
ncbi:MAG: DUF3370 family protein, partial [Microcoleus sp. SIO2G3]|nr:DUF3370 family protein [Microcoleus sp. SIO2G3]